MAASPPSPVAPRLAAVLTDIEGTTTPIAFVHRTLFPFARDRLADFLAAHGDRPDVAAELAQVRRLEPARDPLATLLGWMDQDAKVTPLKALQGLIWREGYAVGKLKGEIYPDVAPALRTWKAAGTRLYVYSSGSEEAQRLIFGHSTAGDLTGLFSGFFDTRIGAKRETASYTRIAEKAGLAPGSVLFLSDVEAELDAAASAGLLTCQLVRARDGTTASPRHPHAATFADVAEQFGLNREAA